MAVTFDIDTGGLGDYASLNAFQSGEVTDITGIDPYLAEGRASGGAADTAIVDFTGWTTSPTNNLTIRQADSDRHGGIWDDTKYRLGPPGSNPFAPQLALSSDNIRVDGLQVTCYNATFRDAITVGADDCTLENLIIKGGGDRVHAIELLSGISGTGTVTIRNCLIYDWSGTIGGGIIESMTAGATGIVDNCTFYNTLTGMSSFGGQLTVTNNLVRNSTTGFNGSFNAASDFNSADDATATTLNATKTSGSPWNSSGDADSDYFLDAGAGDFRSGAGDLHIDVGDDLSASFTYDAVGTTRPTGADTWDLGFFEYVASGVIEFAADVTGTGTVAGTLETDTALFSADISASGIVAGALETDITMVASVTSSGSVVGDLETAKPIAASVSGTGSAAGAIDTDITVAASATAQGTLMGRLEPDPSEGGVVGRSMSLSLGLSL